MIRVAIVDDHPIVRDGIAANLRADPELAVEGLGASVADALGFARSGGIDVLVLDLELLHGNALDAMLAIRAAAPGMRIVVFSAHGGEQRVAEAFARGADSYVLKGTSSDELIAVVRSVAAGGSRIPSEIAEQLARALRTPARDRLTEREREILGLVASGLGNRAIAERLAITERTVKFHVGEILARLGARSRAQAVAIAKARGIV